MRITQPDTHFAHNSLASLPRFASLRTNSLRSRSLILLTIRSRILFSLCSEFFLVQGMLALSVACLLNQ